MKIIFDIEADSLLDKVTRIWVIVAKDADTGKVSVFFDEEFSELFNKADELIGHNIIGYDLPVLEKIFGWKPRAHTKTTDTLLLSQIQDYMRFGNDGHGLKAWGIFLGEKKGEFSDWSALSEEMVEYCRQDVEVSHEVYNYLMYEQKGINSLLQKYIDAEHTAAWWCAQAELHGWPFNFEEAAKLYGRMEKQLEETRGILEERLGWKVERGEEKKLILTKEGIYPVRIAKYFDVDPITGGYYDEDRLILGDYCTVEFKRRSLNSISDVKSWLHTVGWQPTEWNYKKIGRERIKMSPKVTEDSLEFLQEDGKLYLDFLTTRSRFAILKTWLQEIDSQSRVHGSVMLIGTPSMRARHQKITNVPSEHAPWGEEIRRLFICPPGWVIVGADSSGNQARGLAFCLDNPDFTHEILSGDIHTYNANALTAVLKKMGVQRKVERSQAKRILYAFLFGASGAKLWSYIFGELDEENGNVLKRGFQKAVPGFNEFLKRLEEEFDRNKKYGYPYILSLVKNRLYVDSKHKLLVYYLQAMEKITCSVSLALCKKELDLAGIPYQPLIYYHDEIEFMVPEAYGEKAAEIAARAFREGPKQVGISIMDGSAKLGGTWYDVH